MKVKYAIAMLHRMNAKIPSLNERNFDPWFTQLQSYIGTFFGEQSPEYSFLNAFNLDSFGHGGTPWLIEQSKPSLKAFNDSCIETLQFRGLYKKGNILSRIPDKWLVPAVTILIPAIFFGGQFIGKYLSDTQNVELKIENKNLKEDTSRLGVLIRQAANANTNKKTGADTTTHNNSD